MGYDSWTCIEVVKGGGLIDEDLRNALKAAACQLHFDQLSRMFFASETCDGLIKSTGASYRVGGRTGILFSVECTTEGREWQINFLLSEADLERGAQILLQGGTIEPEEGLTVALPFRLPIDDLYRFGDLSSRTIN